MTGKKTKAKKVIERIGGFYGVNYDNKTYKNITEILECYRQIQFNNNLFNFKIIGSEPLENLMPIVYRHFIQDKPLGDACVSKMVMSILNDDKTAGILSDTLDEIRKFSIGVEENDTPIGMLYFDILDRLFFSEPEPVKTAIYTELGMDSHVFSYRMEEATMLFGIYFWQKCLGIMKDWKEMSVKIQEEEGREDLMPALARV